MLSAVALATRRRHWKSTPVRIWSRILCGRTRIHFVGVKSLNFNYHRRHVALKSRFDCSPIYSLARSVFVFDVKIGQTVIDDNEPICCSQQEKITENEKKMMCALHECFSVSLFPFSYSWHVCSTIWFFCIVYVFIVRISFLFAEIFLWVSSVLGWCSMLAVVHVVGNSSGVSLSAFAPTLESR